MLVNRGFLPTPEEVWRQLGAARIAVRYRTPVILLSDLFLANSSEPWQIPATDSLPSIDPAFAEAPTPSQAGVG